MTSPRYSGLAARILSEAHDAAANARSASGAMRGATPPAARDAAIAAIERAIREAKARRRRRAAGWGLGAVAAAAAIALAVGQWRAHAPHVEGQVLGVAPAATLASSDAIAHAYLSGDGATIIARGSSAPAPNQANAADLAKASASSVVEGQTLGAGSRVIARPGGRALLAFATGTQLTVEDGGDLTIVDGGASKLFALGAGALRASVATLAPSERFVVRTPDAEVEARGTSFRVAVAAPDPACGEGTATRVSVYEGTVVVRRGGDEARIEAGDEWPRACPLAKGAHARAAHAASSSGSPGARTTAPPLHAAAASAPVSTLADQNDLFADAVAAKRAGDGASAVTRFEAFLAKYPTSPLAESAAAQRMKLLRDTDRTRAIGAARAYLARWPNGFAKADAEAIAAERP